MLRIAWFSPYGKAAEEAGSRAAYSTRLLLPKIREQYAVDLFVDREELEDEEYHFLTAISRHKTKPYDLFLYQLEDHPLATFVRLHLALKPGVVWFHDVNFTTFGPEPIINSPWRKVVEKFTDPNAEWPVRGDEFPQTGPFGAREAAYVQAALFADGLHHGQWKRRVLSLVAAPYSAYLPLPVEPFDPPLARSADPVFVYTGSPRIEDRSPKILQAFACLSSEKNLSQKLSQKPKLHWLVAAGEVAQARERVAQSGADVEIIPGRSPEKWRELIVGAALAVHTMRSR
jgi:hypothetical protein